MSSFDFFFVKFGIWDFMKIMISRGIFTNHHLAISTDRVTRWCHVTKKSKIGDKVQWMATYSAVGWNKIKISRDRKFLENSLFFQEQSSLDRGGWEPPTQIHSWLNWRKNSIWTNISAGNFYLDAYFHAERAFDYQRRDDNHSVFSHNLPMSRSKLWVELIFGNLRGPARSVGD